jgi:small subunit ribosomal protein S20
MANIKSAKKRIYVIEKKTQRNRRVKSRLKEILKELDVAIANRDKETAREKLALAEKKLMQAAAKGTIHKNTASRKVSRLTAGFRSIFGQEALLEKANTPAISSKKKEAKPEKQETPTEVAQETEAAPVEEAAQESTSEEASAEDETSEKAEKKPEATRKSTKKASIEEATETAAEPGDKAEKKPETDEVPEA